MGERQPQKSKQRFYWSQQKSGILGWSRPQDGLSNVNLSTWSGYVVNLLGYTNSKTARAYLDAQERRLTSSVWLAFPIFLNL